MTSLAGEQGGLAGVNPNQWPQYWDKVIVAGVASPGVARIKDWKRANDWDVKKGKGTRGATLTFVQQPPAEGQIVFELWDDGFVGGTGHNHFAEWDSFVTLLKYDPTKKTADAVSIYHPSLDFIDVTSVVTTKIGNPVQVTEGDTHYTITVDFIEDYPSPPVNASSSPLSPTTTATVPDGTIYNPPPTASDAYQQQIQALLAQAQQ